MSLKTHTYTILGDGKNSWILNLFILSYTLSYSKRHWIHRQSNRIAPNQIKHGRSHRGRPLHQDGLPISGRASRSVAEQATQELAWLNTGNGVQLMSIQPLAPPLALQPTPLSSLPAVNPLHSVRLQQRQLDAYLKVFVTIHISMYIAHYLTIYCIYRFTRIWRDYI